MKRLTNIFKWLTGILSLVLIGLLFISYQLDKELDDLNGQVLRDTAVAETVREPAQPIGVLLLGVDSREGKFNDKDSSNNDSRSDAILVASVNPEKKTTELVTLPRDTLVEMEDRLDKVNHSYVYGGVDLTIKTVSEYLDFPIHYVVEINMQGLEDMVDAVGGVDITPTITFTDKGYDYIEGQTMTMDGHQALTYTRMRKKDPRGDIGRGERQQEVLNALVHKLISFNSIANYTDLLDVVKGNMRTNITITANFIKNYLPAGLTFNRTVVENYQDVMINNVYYLGLDEQERVRVSNILRNNIGLANTITDKTYINEQANQGLLTIGNTDNEGSFIIDDTHNKQSDFDASESEPTENKDTFW